MHGEDTDGRPAATFAVARPSDLSDLGQAPSPSGLRRGHPNSRRENVPGLRGPLNAEIPTNTLHVWVGGVAPSGRGREGHREPQVLGLSDSVTQCSTTKVPFSFCHSRESC